MAEDVWKPVQYERFRRERRAPFDDLLALVRPRSTMRALDLGCGTGELTRILHDTLAARETVGIDSSPAMLEQSAAHVTPGLRFERRDLRQAVGAGTWDLVFSNAALHWIDDHETLLARLTDLLAPGGQLAVQVPANSDHPSHRVAAAVASEEPFRVRLDGVRPPGGSVPAPERYATLLHDLGYPEQHVRLQVYVHSLDGPEDVVEWVKGTTLTAFAAHLPADAYEDFLTRYRTRLLATLAPTRPYVFTFKRILLWGRRGPTIETPPPRR